LITYYDLGSGERTELSAVTFANWVAKTANLLDELGVAPRDAVRLDLAVDAPGHRVTYVWEAACWEVGAVVAPRSSGRGVALCAGDWAGYETSIATDIVVCALRPLGQPAGAPRRRASRPAVEVRRQADRYSSRSKSPSASAWIDDDRQLTAAELAEIGTADTAQRRLVRPTEPWSAVAEGLLTPVKSGGSTVVVVGDDEDAIARIAASERVAVAR
jgi:uncharacterized protein (TIGR03089 family)